MRTYKTIAIAESCTGGLTSHLITNVSGSSKYFKLGIVAYSNESKVNILGVNAALIKRYGAVSKQVAVEMAKGVMRLGPTDIGVGITGIAGPGGSTRAKPVGLVYIALVKKGPGARGQGPEIKVKKILFKGSRENIKYLAAQSALVLIHENIKYTANTSP